MEEIIEAKRDLGDGRWDRILKRKMVELSFANTYEEARDEWKATGRVYKHSHRNQQPEWVDNTNHLGYCLCGRNIVYHFEIENEVTNVKEIVGSDHIGAYLIIKEIVAETAFSSDEITDEMIADWLKAKVNEMKAKSWWEENGSHFKEMFNKIKDLDVAINCKSKQLKMVGTTYQYAYTPKTRASGKFGDYGYEMASIVWRWNHEDNPKNQSIKYGYPNDRLWSDLNLFYAICKHSDENLKTYQGDLRTVSAYQTRNDEFIALTKKRALEREAKLKAQQIAWEEGREEREKLQYEQEQERIKRVAERAKAKAAHTMTILNADSEQFDNLKDYYGIPDFDYSKLDSHERRSLAVIKEMMMENRKLESQHLSTLKRILGGNKNE
tara:strand:- start:120 stop:1265 length:1146 start_codon:yes stop_codon:yes gene_type:complete